MNNLKRFILLPDVHCAKGGKLVEHPEGPWVRLDDLTPQPIGGLSVKAARGIDALLGAAISVPPKKSDTLEFEAYHLRRLFESIGIDLSRAVLQGKIKPKTQDEREHFHKLLKAFLRHQLQS